jgi:mono/diheme cytochrome c family protein
MCNKLGLGLAGFFIASVLGCAAGETQADKEEAIRQARVESVALAEQRFDPTVFDTLTWENDDVRLQRGALVWRSSCEKCHGGRGAGDGAAAEQFGVQVPSFLAPDWAYAGDLDGIRKRIYVGHANGMPSWGLHGLKYRDVDAVASYINQVVSPATTASP